MATQTMVTEPWGPIKPNVQEAYGMLRNMWTQYQPQTPFIAPQQVASPMGWNFNQPWGGYTPGGQTWGGGYYQTPNLGQLTGQQPYGQMGASLQPYGQMGGSLLGSFGVSPMRNTMLQGGQDLPLLERLRSRLSGEPILSIGQRLAKPARYSPTGQYTSPSNQYTPTDTAQALPDYSSLPPGYQQTDDGFSYMDPYGESFNTEKISEQEFLNRFPQYQPGGGEGGGKTGQPYSGSMGGETFPVVPQYYPGSTVAGFDPYQLLGQGAGIQAASQIGQGLQDYSSAVGSLMQPGAGNQQISGQLGSFLGNLRGAGNINPAQIGFQAQAPQVDWQAYMPEVGFQGTGTPSPNDALQQMMSGTPDMNVWSPLIEDTTRSMTRAFQEEVLPSITSEAQAAGQYGSAKQGQEMGLAAGRFGEALSNAQNRLAAEAASQALQQRQAGTGLASGLLQSGEANRLQAAITQAGLGRDIQGQALQAALGRAGLGMDTQRLLGDLATRQAEFGQQASLQNEANRLQAANIYGNMYGQSQNLGLQGQLGALGAFPSLLGSYGMPANILSEVGGQRQGMQQAYIQDAMDRWNYGQQMPQQMAADYYSMLMGQPYTQQRVPMGETSPLSAGLGGAAMGFGMTGSPWGAIGGGVLGLLSARNQ